jgi:hypothetical protein
MPTLSKPQLIETPSPWLTESDRIQQKLCRKGVPILAALGYYAERDLPVPEADQLEVLVQDEQTEIKPIAGALTFAAAASEELPDAGVIATLRKVSRNPSLLRLGRLPPAVEWDIACNYKRGDEKPATHWPDVWGDQPAIFGGLVEVPTDTNIERAALAAIARKKRARKRGRRPNAANQVLADRLGEIFRQSGQRITRHRHPEMRHEKLVFVESGPFYDFLGLVLPPLQAYLRERGLAPVTIDTIVRLATESFPTAR